MSDEMPGVVSVWVGMFTTEADLEEYIEEQYEDEHRPLSPFAAEAGLTWYDHDFLEVSFHEVAPASAEQFLNGHSWSTSFVVALQRALEHHGLQGANAIMLLYNRAAAGRTHPPISDQPIRFLGDFSYDVTAPPVSMTEEA